MPLTEGIVAGLIANALTEIVRYSMRGAGGEETQKHLLEIIQGDKHLATVLSKAIAAVAKDMSLRDQNTTEKLRMFLISPDAEAIVRQMYGLWMIPDARPTAEPHLRSEFVALLAHHVKIASNELRGVANSIFEALMEACDLSLKRAVSKGILLAHEAMSERRFQLLLDEINTIEKNLKLLQRSALPTVEEMQTFEDKYRRQIVQRHGYITPPHFNAARKIPINDIFVPPRLIQGPRRGDNDAATLSYLEFLSSFYRAVILGNPGGGKSTLAGKLTYDLAHDYRKRPLAARQATPILIVLRDYGAMKKERHCSILQYSETIANSIYQVAPPTECFEYMLLNGRAVVVFDGLDELLDTSYRQEITQDIEAFCNLYPAVPILVTSREVGYEQAPLDEERFTVFRLAPFDEKQVDQYVHKWFHADLDLTVPQRQQKASAFLKESRIVSDLRTNPLMLALMCSIYRGENYIPRNRPDVYEKCAIMLFEKWDKSRGVMVALPFDAHINPAMKYLAHWIYSDEKLQGGISEEQLVSKAADYLCIWRYEDRCEAEKASRDFIEFCTGRAWVFTDTGTTKDGDKLYQFTHRTFLEYFTAAHLVRTHATAQQLSSVLLAKIARREWDVVAQLAYQLQNKQIEGASDQLLTALLHEASSVGGLERKNLLSFASRCLEFMVPSPKMVRDIANSCVFETLATVSVNAKQSSERPTELIGNLLWATEENIDPIFDCLEKGLFAGINAVEDSKAVTALSIAGRLLWTRPNWPAEETDVFQKCHSLSVNITRLCAERIKKLAPQWFEAASIGFDYHLVSLRQMIDWYGADALFQDFGYVILPNTFTISIAYRFLMSVVTQDGLTSDGVREQLFSEVNLCGGFLLHSPPPWWRGHGRTPFFAEEDMFEQTASTPKSPPTLSPSVLFGAFALCAGLLAGVSGGMDSEHVHAAILTSTLPFFDQLRWVFLCQFEESSDKRARDEIERSGFDKEQRAFVEAWIRKEIILGEIGEFGPR